MTPLSAAHHKMLARICEPVWLQQFLGWRITAPLNDNRADPAPLGAA
jgi:hypothetical protein